jgi:hypothetical protein
MALSHCGSDSSIESINENNKPAKLCKLWYDGARLATLEVYNWTFARKTMQLAPHGTAAPELRWKFRYQLPANCVKPRMIENPLGQDADAIPFEVEIADDETLSLVCDQEQARLIYTFDQSDVALMSFHFVMMTSIRLATFINGELTGKHGIGDRLERKFEQMLTDAPNSDADGEFPRKERDAVWIRGR